MNLFGYTFQAEYIIGGMAGVIFLLLIFDAVQFVKLSSLKRRLAEFTVGSDAKSLEDEMKEKFSQINALRTAQAKADSDIKVIFSKLVNAYQKSAVYKYDAFREMGGQLSAVLVMLDEKDNGFLINSVHNTSTTGGNYMYMKEIKEGLSAIELSEEEAAALAEAISGKKRGK